jgi:hypothetical protein
VLIIDDVLPLSFISKGSQTSVAKQILFRKFHALKQKQNSDIEYTGFNRILDVFVYSFRVTPIFQPP